MVWSEVSVFEGGSIQRRSAVVGRDTPRRRPTDRRPRKVEGGRGRDDGADGGARGGVNGGTRRLPHDHAIVRSIPLHCARGREEQDVVSTHHPPVTRPFHSIALHAIPSRARGNGARRRPQSGVEMTCVVRIGRRNHKEVTAVSSSSQLARERTVRPMAAGGWVVMPG